jgi:hypothetical protein
MAFVLHPLQNQILHKNDSSLQAQIYARFSPLIGGPPILPLHVELMIYNEQRQIVNGDIDIILHRIDYIPMNPTDRNTILNLLRLKYVPGSIRHRIYLSSDAGLEQTKDLWTMHLDDTNQNNNGDNNNNSNGKDTQISIVNKDRIQYLIQDAFSIPLFSTIEYNDILMKLAPRLMELFVEKEETGLHLLYYNCYSFAYDVYSCMKKTLHGL